MAANKYRVIKCSNPRQHGPNVTHAVVVRKAIGCIRADYHTITKEGAISAAQMMNNPIDVAAIESGDDTNTDAGEE